MSVLKRRSRMISFRVSEDEYAGLKNLCVDKGARSVSDMARDAVHRLIFNHSWPNNQAWPNHQLETVIQVLQGRIEALDLEQGSITVHRRAEGGVQVLKTSLPCLVTVLEGINEMRFATMDDMFRAARHPLKIWDKSAAGIDDLSKIGLKGSPTIVAKVFAPQPKAQKAERIETQSGAPKDIAATLLSKLLTHHPQLGREIAKRAS